MNHNFLQQVFFEYKKILKRKSTYLAFALILITTIISIFGMIIGDTYTNGEKSISKYAQMNMERERDRALAGPIDEAFLTKIISENQIAISDKNNFVINENGTYLKEEIYNKYCLPYERVRGIIGYVYAKKGSDFEYEALDRLTVVDAKLFEEKRLEKIQQNQSLNYYTEAEIQSQNKMNEQITMPFTFGNGRGYVNFLLSLSPNGTIIMLAIIICIAQIFAGEYSGKTDQVILTTRYGKNKVIVVKIVTGVLLAIMVSVISLFILLLGMLSVYGFDGADISFQMMSPFSPYPITLLQAVFITIGVITASCVLIAMITMLLSALLKTPFGVIIITNLLLFVPAFITIGAQNRFFNTLLNLCPGKMLDYELIFSGYFFHVFGFPIPPTIFLPIFSVIFGLFLIPFIYRAFRNHQIS